MEITLVILPDPTDKATHTNPRRYKLELQSIGTEEECDKLLELIDKALDRWHNKHDM